MKLPFLKPVLFFTAVITIFCSCQKESIVENDQNIAFSLESRLTEKLNLKKSASEVSLFFQNIGVTKFLVNQISDEEIEIFADSFKSFGLNGKSTSMSSYPVILKKDLLYLKNNKDYAVTIVNEKPYFINPDYEGPLTEDLLENENNVVLLILLKELTFYNNNFINSSRNSNKEVQACSAWDTYWEISTGLSRTTAEANLKDAIAADEEIEEGNCVEIGGSDTSCSFENHGCVSTQAYCCDF